MSSKSDLEVAGTLSLEGAGVPVASVTGPPLASWDRYEVLELLGKGGMGVVHKARDRRLQRTIAIKFLLGADPNLMLRFLREARTLARIDHPNICRVYEVGAVEGRSYIALQLVGGDPLSKAATHMSLDEKIAVMRDVAAAIDEAHRLDVVHRDLKPANIMVERTEGARWFPIVMDFGLARELTVEVGLTESGALLGTPAYMSPEQARGDTHAIDRRSDVYSLGATLYELLTERPPFSAASLAETLTQVIHDDPATPRSLVPSLPVDLEIIALKCLAKDPGQRYQSARALADDLGRYLDGEPILGRRLSLWQRLRLRARRHRALVILGACSLAIILAVAALGLRTWLIAGERARLAERLGRETTEIEGSLREAYLWPLHDTTPDRQRVRQRMAAIAATRHDLGDDGDALVHDALGRGHLALHEWQEAAAELARAEAAGRQTPELHAARARALGELYHRALEDARRSNGSEGWIAKKKQELVQQYLTPVLAEIEKSRTSGGDTGLFDASLAFYQRDFAVAEEQALEVARRSPGLSEARKLAADAVYGAAVKDFDHGDYQIASLGLERSTKLYAEASELGRSDASLHQAAAQAWLQRAEAEFRQGRSPLESLDQALDIIDNHALLAEPDNAKAYAIKSYVLLSRYRLGPHVSHGDPRPLLDRIAEAAERAVQLEPSDAHAWTALGRARIYRGRYELETGGQDEPWWTSALAALGQALAIQPDHVMASNALGAAHRWIGTSLDQAGLDPMAEYRLALRSYERAATIDPQDLLACTYAIDIYVSIAEYNDVVGSDPAPAVGSAQRVGERCLAIDPHYYAILDNLAQAHLALAQHLAETGQDPTAALAYASGYIDRTEESQFEIMTVWYRRLVAARIEATLKAHQGADPTRWLVAGRVALEQARRRAAVSAFAQLHVEAARLDLAEAEWAERTQRDQVQLLAQALVEAKKAVEHDARLATAKLTAAEVCLRMATTRPSQDIVELGISYTQQVLDRNPSLHKAQTLRAELLRRRMH